MAKIIKLTEQDLYRIVKRVIKESNGTEGVITQCIKSNTTIQDAVKAAQFFVQCESCRRIVWLTGLQAFQNMMTGGEFKIPSPGDIIKIIINDPEIKNLAMPCFTEMTGYYKGMSEQDKTELKNKMSSIVACIVREILGGNIPVDLPMPGDIELPDGFPIPKGEDIEDMMKKGKDEFEKMTGIKLPGM